MHARMKPSKTHLRAKGDASCGELCRPVSPTGGGVQHILLAHVDNALQVLVEEKPGRQRERGHDQGF